MGASVRSIVFLVLLLSVLAWGQREESKARLLGTVVDQSGAVIIRSRITLYEVGRNDPTAETHPDAKGGEFEFSVRRNRSYRLVAESVGFTSKAVEIKLDGDTQLRPIALEVKDSDEGPFVPDDGIELQFKNVPSPDDLLRQTRLTSLPLVRSAIDLRLLFPPLDFQPEIQGPQKRNRRQKPPSDRLR